MLDWSSIFNITFIAAAGALSLFLLVSTIAVLAKGKRKCNAFDVILRIISTLALIASAACVASVVLIMLDGEVCIKAVSLSDVGVAGEYSAVLIFGSSTIELPLPELFVALSSTVGSNAAVILLVLSIVALTADCLIANKKDPSKKKSEKPQKTKTQPVKKSPEQLKREAEIERIKRLGERAVLKADSAASATEKPAGVTEKPAPAEPAAQPAPEQSVQPKSSADTNAEQDDFDWRAEPQEQKPASFVGIKDQPDEFDTFDSFDSFDSDGVSETENNTEQDSDDTEPEIGADDGMTQTVERSADEPVTEQLSDTFDNTFDTFGADTDEPAEQDDAFAHEPEQSDVADDEQTIDEQFDTEEDSGIETEQANEDSNAEQETTDESVDSNSDYDDLSAWQYDERLDSVDSAGDDNSITDNADGDGNAEALDGSSDESKQPFEPAYDTRKQAAASARVIKPIAPEQEIDEGIAPDRRIYMPKPKTLVRGKGATDERGERPARPAAKRPSTKKPSGGDKTAAAVGGKQRGGKRPTSTTPKTKTDGIPAEKKLPLTRRYVILDRHNAVNMFGEYLNQRKNAEQDKLKSSINTIIIE